MDEIELFELNEAFASQAAYCVDRLGLPSDRVNVCGGAIALGHPLGCTGARQLTTLLYQLRRRSQTSAQRCPISPLLVASYYENY